MVDLGDELIVGINRVPWLIWIQILVTFLLLIIIYFSIFAFDLSDSTSVASPSTDATTSFLPRNKAGCIQSMRGEIVTSTSRRIVRGGEIIRETEGTSRKEAAHFKVSENFIHPCNYFELAKQAFLKCLGLDFSNSESSSTRDHNIED